MSLSVRWLGRVNYHEADQLQRAIHDRTSDDYLLLLEHPHTYTLGRRADRSHVLSLPEKAELIECDRGGDVTYHGPGQLVGYPIVTLPDWRGGQRDVVGYLRSLERVLIDALGDLGVQARQVPSYTGVWVGNEKIGAIGVHVAQGRTRHGFALNVDCDLEMFSHIVPCGISDRGVTSLAALGVKVSMEKVCASISARFAEYFEYADVDFQHVVWKESHKNSELSRFGTRTKPTQLREGLDKPRLSRKYSDTAGTSSTGASVNSQPVRLLGRLAQAGVQTDIEISTERPDWMRVRATQGEHFQETAEIVRAKGLNTVCAEAGCPNIYECWSDHTATFMILGERCTRACGFCLVDTQKPLEVDSDEPRRVAEAISDMKLEHAVITCVARDDLSDDGAGIFAETVHEIRRRSPGTAVELLISDCRGKASSLDVIFASRPDVLNHNIETVPRLQRAARPSAGYARSLSVLARAKDFGLLTKSGLIMGMGETLEEAQATLRDLRAVGVDIVTIGQYLRPTAQHLPVAKWWHPDEFAALRDYGMSLGFTHVEAGPLVRSSYHAKSASQVARLGQL